MSNGSANYCNTSNYESFKILRSIPLCANSNAQACANVWWTAIQGTPGKLPDPNNKIAWPPVNTNFSSVPNVDPIVTSSGQTVNINSIISSNSSNTTPLIVDSTRIVIHNLVNGNFIDVTQEDAYCVFISNQACTSVMNATSACYPVSASCYQNVCLPDGVLQFLALISIAPSCTWLGSGLVITISPLNNNVLFQNCTAGNWCPFSFSIGNCNTQSSTASVLYLTCPNPSGYGYVYSANYANIRFTLLYKQKVASGGVKKACFLGVDSLDKGCFLVFFGQQRLIGTANILLISPIVDLKSIVWQPVFIVTTNTPLTLTCGASV
jgi:hypothetical protein